MNLQPVHPITPDCSVICCQCGEWVKVSDVLADLEGEAFKSYYCKPCALEPGQEEVGC